MSPQSHTKPTGSTRLAVTFCIVLYSAAAASSGSVPTARVFLLVLDRVSWADLKEQRLRGGSLCRVIEGGATAALNTQTANGISSPAAAVTLSAGYKAGADDDSGEVCNADEPADSEYGRGKDIFQRRTGIKADDHQVLVLKICSIRERNAFLGDRTHPGRLGFLLARKGLKTAALGCADLSPCGRLAWQARPPSRRFRFGTVILYRNAPLIAMDEKGRIDYGDVSRILLQQDADAPFGWRTNTHALLSRLKTVLERSDLFLCILDFGDTFRADEYSTFSGTPVARKHVRQAVERADQFLAALLPQMDKTRDRLFVLSLSPPLSSPYELCPLIAYGNGFSAGGLLTSASTGRPGVVTLPDLTASILQYAEPQSVSVLQGKPIRVVSVPSPEAWQRVGDLIRRCAEVDGKLRIPSLAILAFLEVIILLLALAHVNSSRRKGRTIRLLLLSLFILPVVLFWVTPLFLRVQSPFLGMGIAWCISWSAAWIVMRIFRTCALSLLLVCALMSLSILIDLVAGLGVSFNSLLGYSPFIGARYYGLGNECMTLLLSSLLVLVGVSLSFARPSLPITAGKTLAALLTFGICLFLIGFPRYGSDFGGTIAAACAFAVALFRLRALRLIRYRWMGVCIALVGLLTFCVWTDLREPARTGHMGRLVSDIGSYGLQPLQATVLRKLSILGRSFRHPHWDIALAVVIAILCCIPALRRAGRLPAMHRFPAYAACMSGLLCGTLVAFLVNDSGAVIPALAALYGLGSLFYLSLDGTSLPSERADDTS